MMITLTVGLTLLDALVGTAYRTGTDQQVHVRGPLSDRTENAIIVFPGYIMPGDLLATALHPHLRPTDALLVAKYAERGVDMDDLYRKLMAEVSSLNPRHLRIYGASMGGMCAREFLTRYAESDLAYGPVTLVLDTAPSSSRNVKRPRFLFWLASWYRGGPVSSAAWAAVSKLADPAVTPEATASPQLVSNAKSRAAWAGMPALTTQASFIDHFPPLKASELADSTSQVVYLRAANAERDPLVDVDASIIDWSRAFPGLITETISTRQGEWHIPLIERPEETMRSILAP